MVQNGCKHCDTVHSKVAVLVEVRKSPGTNALGFEPVNHGSSTGVSWAPSNPSTALLCVQRHRKTSTEDITHHLKITRTVAFFPISK